MSGPTHRPGRLIVAALAIAAVTGFVALDLLHAPPIEALSAPPPVALGSGAAPGGAHCSGH